MVKARPGDEGVPGEGFCFGGHELIKGGDDVEIRRREIRENVPDGRIHSEGGELGTPVDPRIAAGRGNLVAEEPTPFPWYRGRCHSQEFARKRYRGQEVAGPGPAVHFTP